MSCEWQIEQTAEFNRLLLEENQRLRAELAGTKVSFGTMSDVADGFWSDYQAAKSELERTRGHLAEAKADALRLSNELLLRDARIEELEKENKAVRSEAEPEYRYFQNNRGAEWRVSPSGFVDHRQGPGWVPSVLESLAELEETQTLYGCDLTEVTE